MHETLGVGLLRPTSARRRSGRQRQRNLRMVNGADHSAAMIEVLGNVP
jgi:hypothetical protein